MGNGAKGSDQEHPHVRAAKAEVDERVRHGAGEAQAAVDEPLDDAEAAAAPDERESREDGGA